MLESSLMRVILPSDVKVVRPVAGGGPLPSVTVVIPCYNYGHYIARCVQSVLDQPGVRTEVIIIDDASPDGSGEVVEGLAAQNSRVRAIRHAKNMGHIATYNEGLEQATGDYCVLLSADDLLTAGALGRATRLMEVYPDIGMTYGFSVDFRDDELPSVRTAAKAWAIWSGYDWIAQRCKTGRNILRSPEAVVRTSVQHKVGGYRADLPHAGDFEMWMRIATVSGIGFIAGADQAYYRVHAANMHHSSFDIVSDLRQRLESFEAVLGVDSMLTGDKKVLSDLARRALSREALQHAISRAALPNADQKHVDGCRELALLAWPGARHFGEWETLEKVRRQGAEAVKSTIALHENARKLEYTLRWRRRRLAGF